MPYRGTDCRCLELFASNRHFSAIWGITTLNATISRRTLRTEMARRKQQATAQQSENQLADRKRVSVNVTGFEEDLAEVCRMIEREEADFGRLVIRAAVAMVLRERRLVTPLWLAMAEPPREVEV